MQPIKKYYSKIQEKILPFIISMFITFITRKNTQMHSIYNRIKSIRSIGYWKLNKRYYNLEHKGQTNFKISRLPIKFESYPFNNKQHRNHYQKIRCWLDSSFHNENFDKKNNFQLQKRTHPFFIAPYAEYPLLLSFSLFWFIVFTVNYLHSLKVEYFGLVFELIMVLILWNIFYWSYDMKKLGSQVQIYNKIVRQNLKTGIILFIISEIMIFFGLFWAYFHSSLNPSVELGAIWPPAGLVVLEWWKWPTLSTALLVYSGFTINSFYYSFRSFYICKLYLHSNFWLFSNSYNQTSQKETIFSYSYILFFLYELTKKSVKKFDNKNVKNTVRSKIKLSTNLYYKNQLHILYGNLLFTIFAGFIFILCQLHEYNHAQFSMDDGIYASVFFSLTGLHGLHVFAGLILLIITFFNFISGYFSTSHKPHIAVIATVWYWHFVDIVWIFLYFIVYIWGNSTV